MRLLSVLALLLPLLLGGLPAAAAGADGLPPAPKNYCTDTVGFLSPAARAEIEALLQQNEKATSNQILVVIYPRVPGQETADEYADRLAQKWKVGQQGKDNGLILFLFVAEHRIRIEVGYGLEGAVTDVLCNRIIDTEMRPRLRANDRDGGVRAGVLALIAASRGEYKGTGETAAQAQADQGSSLAFWILVALLILAFFIRRRGGGAYYSAGGFGTGFGTGYTLGRWGRGDDGDGFSGGGGRFGGGGAGGSW
ncbi:MAG: TPM domain-containing protein [Verrucomicrobium sp.]|nr:TPM domain-containing protein [Verrucomicrobium sp.]